MKNNQTNKLRKTARFEQEVPSASVSSNPLVVLEYLASGETQDRPVCVLCSSQVFVRNSGRAELRRGRSDFNDALSTLNRLRQEAGEEQLRQVPFRKYQNWHQSSRFSSSWWQWRGLMVELIIQMKVRIYAHMQSDIIER